MPLMFMLAGTCNESFAGQAIPGEKHIRNWQDSHRNFFRKMQQANDEFWNDFALFFERPFLNGGNNGAVTVLDKQAVLKLPEIVIEKGKDGRSLTLEVKDLAAKKEDVKIEFDEDEGYAEVVFPYQESKAVLKIYPTAMSIDIEKKIIHEKKDEKGTILSSSSDVVSDKYMQSFPYRVNVSTLQPEYKNGVLTLKIGSRQARRAVSLK